MGIRIQILSIGKSETSNLFSDSNQSKVPRWWLCARNIDDGGASWESYLLLNSDKVPWHLCLNYLTEVNLVRL